MTMRKLMLLWTEYCRFYGISAPKINDEIIPEDVI